MRFNRARQALATCRRLIAGSLLALFLPLPALAVPDGRTPVIVDTDMGADDWLALAYIAQNPRFELLGITVVGNGLAPCPEGAFNAQYLLDLAGNQAPVGCGSPWPKDGFASYPVPWREASRSMMGSRLPHTPPDQAPEDGPRLLARLLAQAREPVDIIALGAMTNIAAVLHAQPSLRAKIRKITSMGGAVGIAGNLRVPGFTADHTNAEAEWNFYIDPVAARRVFESGIPLLLVPLNATNQVPLTRDFIERLRAARSTPAQAFVLATVEHIAATNSSGEYYHWDPLAAVVAGDPGLCRLRERRRLTVADGTGGDTGVSGGQPPSAFPLTGWNGRLRQALSQRNAGAVVSSSKGSPVDVCMGVDPAAFEAQYLRVIGRQ